MHKHQLIFDKPATDFQEALPVGNGRIGAVIYGEVLREKIVLNESSMWSGSRQDADKEGASQYLPRLRELLAEGYNYEAQELYNEVFTCAGNGSNCGHGADAKFGCYQLMGMLHISYLQAVSSGREGSYGVKEYHRSLDLESGLSCISFRSGDVQYRRECLASKKYDALFLELTASEKGKMNISVGLDRDENFSLERLETDTLLMTGQLEDGAGGENGIHYACAVTVIPQNGEISGKGLRIRVSNADRITVIVTMRTDLSGFMGRIPCDACGSALNDLDKARQIPYESVKEEHIAWFSGQAGRVELDFESPDLYENLTTAQRLQQFNKTKSDSNLLALYLDYARYLMISCSQKDSLPANLQGLWTDEIQTPWNGDWHLNAQQEIYWLVEKAGLGDLHVPYLKFTTELVEAGKKTASIYYQARGWVVHTMTNPWGFTSPLEKAEWGATVGSAAWLCHHLFDHYLYILDQDYLNKVYPVMKEAALFYIDMLVRDEKTGFLVISPSSSPENVFLDSEGERCYLCQGSAYDRELVADLFENCISAQNVLKNDREFQSTLMSLIKKLALVEISGDGRIREWDQDYREAFPFHRHLSHLWGVYPGNQISVEKTPDLALAARKSLLHRGKTTAGWALAYRGCVAARLRDGEVAYAYLCDAMQTATAPNMMNFAYHCDETSLHFDLPDTENTRYQFQIDGNEANANCLLLMLLDDDTSIDQDGNLILTVYFLPALPRALSCGSVHGLRTKANLEVSMDWRDGQLLSVALKGSPLFSFTAVYAGKKYKLTLDENGFCNLENDFFSHEITN